jgi:hypothetical protein
MQQSIAAGLLWIVAGAILTNVALENRSDNCGRDFTWVYWEGVCLCFGGSVCWLNSLVTWVAKRDVADDGEIENRTVRAIQCAVVLNFCQRLYTYVFHSIWIMYGLFLFFVIDDDVPLQPGCESLRTLGKGAVVAFGFMLAVFAVVHCRAAKRIGRPEDRV